MKWVGAWLAVAALAVIYTFWVLADAGSFDLDKIASGPKWQAIFGSAVAALSLGMAFANEAESHPDEEALPPH